MNNDAMCLCGHTLDKHWGGQIGSCHMGKDGRLINIGNGPRYADNCLKFKLDNLKYLEHQLEKREEDNNVSRD